MITNLDPFTYCSIYFSAYGYVWLQHNVQIML